MLELSERRLEQINAGGATPEHYLPLLYVLAQCRQDELATFPVEGFDGGSVSLLAARIGEVLAAAKRQHRPLQRGARAGDQGQRRPSGGHGGRPLEQIVGDGGKVAHLGVVPVAPLLSLGHRHLLVPDSTLAAQGYGGPVNATQPAVGAPAFGGRVGG